MVRHNRAKNFVKAKAGLHKIRRCLNKYDYKTESVIHFPIQSQVLAKCRYYRVQLHLDSDGLFSITYTIDWQQLRDDQRFDGIYLLKTNVDKEAFSTSEVLKSYKNQPQIERCFSTVKQPPITVSPVWLDNSKRIESRLFLVFIALLLIALLEREGREKVWPKQIRLRPEGRDHLPLTAKVLLAAFDSIAIVGFTFRDNGRLMRQRRSTPLSLSQRQVLLALAFPLPQSYLKPVPML